MKTLRPRDFTEFPFDSVFKHTETEIVARNIMVILGRHGNQWRQLTWDEYRDGRSEDGEYPHGESAEFEKVVDFCVSPETARLFSPSWRAVYEKGQKDG